MDIKDFKTKTKLCFHHIKDMYGVEDIENMISEYLTYICQENFLHDIKILEILIGGSRCRGKEKESSDLDIIIFYDGDIREDDFFNILSKESFYLEDILVDFNPIQTDNVCLSEYLISVETYLEEN